MSDLLIQEIEEDLRRDRARAIWKRHGLSISMFVLALVVLIAGWRGYVAWQNAQASKDGDFLYDAIVLSDAAPSAESNARLQQLIASGHGGTNALAQFRLASDKARAGDTAAAIVEYDAIAGSASYTSGIQDMARLRAGSLMLDTGSREDVAARVERLTGAVNAYRHTARELMGISAYKAKDLAGAARWFDMLLADPACPADTRNRGQVILTLLAADGMTVERARETAPKE